MNYFENRMSAKIVKGSRMRIVNLFTLVCYSNSRNQNFREEY
mgnify:CR=1 FL=1